MEVAGLVLGAFPIMCGAAKQLKPVFQNVKWWWKFETSFEDFAARIATQEIFYQQVLERLIERLDVSDDEYHCLLTKSNTTLWYESRIREGLQQRFHGDQYYWIMDNLTELHELVTELRHLLPDKVGMMVRINTRYASILTLSSRCRF